VVGCATPALRDRSPPHGGEGAQVLDRAPVSFPLPSSPTIRSQLPAPRNFPSYPSVGVQYIRRWIYVPVDTDASPRGWDMPTANSLKQ
jgi:hypothetical protein